MLQPYHAAATNTRVISAAVLLSALVDLGVPSAEAFALVPAIGLAVAAVLHVIPLLS